MTLSLILPAVGVLSGLGLLFGILLAYASRRFEVEVDPRTREIMKALPGLNCAICGYTGCVSFADAVVAGEVDVTGCTAGGAEVAHRIAEIMGLEAPDVEPQKAYVQCGGGTKEVARRFEYVGYADCHLANQVGGGPSACGYGCLGYGSCVPSCPYGLIKINEDGLPDIFIEDCTGCGACVEACPRGVIALLPERNTPFIACISQDPGKVVRKACSVGCIACNICERVCPQEAIHMEGNLAVIDHEKCDGCGLCVEKCPTKCILTRQLAVMAAASQQQAV